MTTTSYQIRCMNSGIVLGYWKDYVRVALEFETPENVRKFLYDIIAEPDKYHEFMKSFYETDNVEVVKCIWEDTSDGNDSTFTFVGNTFTEYKEFLTLIEVIRMLYERKFIAHDKKIVEDAIIAQDARKKEIKDWVKKQVEVK